MFFSQGYTPAVKIIVGCAIAALSFTLLSGCKEPQPAEIQRHTMNPWEKDIGYVEVAEVNGTVYVSGVACGGDSYEKAVTECYKELKSILQKLNLTSKNIVKETIFTKNIESLKEQIPARKKFYEDGIYPAATWIEMSRLYQPEQIVEIELIAERTK